MIEAPNPGEAGSGLHYFQPRFGLGLPSSTVLQASGDHSRPRPLPPGFFSVSILPWQRCQVKEKMSSLVIW